MPPPAVAPGTTIDRYRIEAVVGAGSMGDVYRGIDEDLQRRVAIKILSERHRDNKELRARFVREARAVAAISHRNVVQVFTTGTFDGRPYIAMEFLDGIDLGTSVAKDGRWDSLAAAAAIRDAASGLDGAARAGLIHRDVKPTNLVLLQDRTVKVTDFGLAKPLEPRDEPALTALGVVVGTPDYIAPEQARGDRIDHRVDIYALGGTLYFLLTGIPPFRTGNPADDKYLKVVARHLRNPVPDVRVRNPGADAELAELAFGMMAKKPAERPDYDAIIAQLGDIARRLEQAGDSGARPRHASAQPVLVDGRGNRAASSPVVIGERPGSEGAGAPVGPGASVNAGVGVGVNAGPSRARTGAPDARAATAGPPVADQREIHEDAPTHRRMPRLEPVSVPGGAPAGLLDGSLRVIQPRMPRWVRVATVLAALTFVVGVALTVLGPRMLDVLPLDRAPVLSEVSPVLEPTQAAPAQPRPPPGMLLVVKPDGAPWFFVDAGAVSRGDYKALFPQHTMAGGPPDEPVTGIAFHYARAFAQSKGKRLLTAEEWRAATQTEGFRPTDGLWEWVTDASDKRDQHAAIHPSEGLATRGGANAGDVTFRLATDP
jgi:eukaryotic-like serine/threonine-protein kinase